MSGTSRRAPAARLWWYRLAEEGGDGGIPYAIVFPVMLVLLWLALQTYSLYHAAELAQAAAREGAHVGRGYESSAHDGAAHARSLLRRAAGDNLRDVQVSTAGSTGQRVRIEVRGQAPSLLPGLSGISVTRSATGAVERWVPQTGGER